MMPFYTRFPTLAQEEIRVVLSRGRPDIPDGEYGFVEYYCTEPDCDCQRVLIHVKGRTTGAKIWATLNYGWETLEFYAAWASGEDIAKQMTGVLLDPLNPQTQYSKAFLHLFERLIQDQAYVNRLKRHYQMFKGAVKQEAQAKAQAQAQAKAVRPKKSKRSRR